MVFLLVKIKNILRSSFSVLFVPQLTIVTLFLILSEDTKLPEAKQGVLDLTKWDEQQTSLVTLDGEWEFFWNQHLSYTDFRQNPRLQPDLYAMVPEKWNNYLINGSTISGSGYSTYKLQVKVNNPDKSLSLKVMPLSTAYRIYINEQLLVFNGQASTNRDDFQAHGAPETIEFLPPSEIFDIIVHVSNYNYAKGGMNRPLILGTPDEMAALNQKLVYKDMFLLGSLVIACFYSLCMYFMNREEKISLFFALVCIVFIFRVFLSSSYLIYEIFPTVNIQVTEWINYTTFHVGILVYSLMIREFFPTLFSSWVRKFLIVLTAIILVLLIIFPMSVYTRFYLVSDGIGLLIFAYLYYISLRAAVVKEPYSRLIFFGTGLLIAFVIVDIINTELNQYEMGYFSNYGFFVFIFVYAFILAHRFSMSFIEAKLLSQRLLELDKLKDEFLANTSHELKTPLHGIISISESLVAGVEGPLNKGQSRNLDLVIKSGRRLTNIINDILDISKLKYGDIRLSRKHIHVQPLVEFVLQMIKLMYAHKPIVWTQHIPKGLPPVFADEGRLVQILYNLIGNAAKFTNRGEVKITTVEKWGQVEISVSDTGIGMSSEQIDAIFQPFTQADASIIRTYGGIGLGLSITKHLVELHGGQIGISAVLGQGSCFTVRLPVGDQSKVEIMNEPAYDELLASHKQQAGEVDSISGVVQSGEHILVVDDDYTNLQSALNVLKLDGYTVTTVMSGREALEVLRQTPDIRLVILDVMMPELSGYEVCQIIRETRSYFELPVLMLTAKQQPEDLVLGFQAGTNDFLGKPFEPMEFRARVRTLIQLNKSMNQALNSEIAFLQAQIKPHFIYNTLNAISYFCMVDGAKANELIEHFSTYLRSSFDFKNREQYITLEKELEFVNTYVEIEKTRFGERLQLEYDIAESVMSIKIPPLILQPLVENAILHGVLKKIEGGLVKITVKWENQDITFRVTDTGIGIPADKLNGLLSDTGKHGVGLRNIHLRLKNLYGSGIHISSVEDEGTEVSFSIPRSKEIR